MKNQMIHLHTEKETSNTPGLKILSIDDYFRSDQDDVFGLMITRVPVAQEFISKLVDLNYSQKIRQKAFLSKRVLDSGFSNLIHEYVQKVVIFDQNKFLSPKEMIAIRNCEKPSFYIVGGYVDHRNKAIVLYKGDLSTIIVPFNFFKPSAVNKPNFMKFSVIDGGTALKLGSYEASTHGILYERDEEYRKFINKQRKEQDRTFGACLYRARKLKGFNQDDFDGVTRATIIRIENNETKTIRSETKKIILKTLGMSEEEIMTY